MQVFICEPLSYVTIFQISVASSHGTFTYRHVVVTERDRAYCG